MPEPVTTYVLTFESSIPDDEDRRASLNQFLKRAKRAYGLRLKNMRTETRAQRAPLNPRIQITPAGRPYIDIVETVNKRLAKRGEI